jgi:hypothetical protein
MDRNDWHKPGREFTGTDEELQGVTVEALEEARKRGAGQG